MKNLLALVFVVFILSSFTILLNSTVEEVSTIPVLQTETIEVSNSQLNLTLIEPANLLNASSGTQFKVSLNVVNPVNDSATEVVISYSPELVKINDENDIYIDSNKYLALNKNINNNTGILSFDLAKIGIDGFNQNETIAIFNFVLLSSNQDTTKINIAEGSSFGSNKKLTEDQLTSLNLKLKEVPVCGDETKDDSEQCDNGNKNGIRCMPTKDNGCEFCTKACTVQTVDPTSFAINYEDNPDYLNTNSTNNSDTNVTNIPQKIIRNSLNLVIPLVIIFILLTGLVFAYYLYRKKKRSTNSKILESTTTTITP